MAAAEFPALHGHGLGGVLRTRGRDTQLSINGLLPTFLPDTRVAMGVEDRNHLDPGCVAAVIDRMWETAK
jgi:hypothetical protein